MKHNVRDFGALGDGIHLDTAAIQRAVDAGGCVYFPAGTYLTGTVYLKSGGGLELDVGAVILGSPDPADYNRDDFCPQNETCPEEHVSGAHLIVAVEQEDIFITGHGRIDGNRKAFTDTVRADAPFLFRYAPWRPAQMIYFCECRQVELRGVAFDHAPYWTILLHGCEEVNVHDIRIRNDRRTLNGDGLDIDCCSRVTVRGCDIDTGDDCITLRANSAPLKHPRACEYVTVSDCILRTRCNGLRIGVGDGLIRNCLFSNLIVRDTMCGVCIVSSYSDGAAVEIRDLRFDNLLIDAGRALAVKVWHLGPDPARSGKVIENIFFSHLTAHGDHGSFIAGLPDVKISGVTMEDARFSLRGGEHLLEKSEWREMAPVEFTPSAIHVENADHVALINSQVTWEPGCRNWETALSTRNTADVSISGSRLPEPDCAGKNKTPCHNTKPRKD